MLTEKDYCDYETCVALKELGFKQLVDWYFNEGKNIVPLHARYRNTFVPRITFYEAQKWLREEKGIHIEVYACAGGYIYELCKAYKPNSFSGGTTIYTPNDVDNQKLNDAGRYETYEEALAEGIKEAVKILKEK